MSDAATGLLHELEAALAEAERDHEPSQYVAMLERWRDLARDGEQAADHLRTALSALRWIEARLREGDKVDAPLWLAVVVFGLTNEAAATYEEYRRSTRDQRLALDEATLSRIRDNVMRGEP